MLTQNEKRWLASRKDECTYCHDTPRTMCLYGERPAHCARVDIDWQDAAEFSERVAAVLAEMPFRGLSQHDIFEELMKTGKPFAWIALRNARLVVEEEMDSE